MKRYMALLACIFALTACGNQSDADTAADASGSSGSDTSTSADGGSGDSSQGSPTSDTSESAQGGDSSESSESSDNEGEFSDPKERRSYALGMDIGNSLKELPLDIDVEALSAGVSDTVGGGDTRLSQQELEGVMKSFVQEMEAEQQSQAQEQAQTNQEKGQKFLAENKNKEGVETTDSGLQYKVVEDGDGPSPDENDTVTVHYEGKLIDGTVFDSSRERGEPVTFPVNAVIPGWTEALQLMKQGAKYELYIPADLAYGERGAGAQIGPNETLIFDVELLEVDNSDGSDSDAAASSDTQNDQAQGQSDQDETSQGQAGQADPGQSTQESTSQNQADSPSQDSSSESEMSQSQSDPGQSSQDEMSQDQTGQGQSSLEDQENGSN